MAQPGLPVSWIDVRPHLVAASMREPAGNAVRPGRIDVTA